MPRTYNLLLTIPKRKGHGAPGGSTRGRTRLGQDHSGGGELWAEAFIMVSVGETGEVWSASQITYAPTLVSVVSVNGFSGPWSIGTICRCWVFGPEVMMAGDCDLECEGLIKEVLGCEFWIGWFAFKRHLQGVSCLLSPGTASP